jgi:hypothetical protein
VLPVLVHNTRVLFLNTISFFFLLSHLICLCKLRKRIVCILTLFPYVLVLQFIKICFWHATETVLLEI